MPNLPIRTRLNLLIGAQLVFALGLNLAMIILSAGPRIRAEDASVLRVSRQAVEQGLSDLEGAPDPARALSKLLDRMTGIRHAIVYLEPPPKPGAGETVRKWKVAPGVPAWFTSLLHPERSQMKLPVKVGDANLGNIVIATNPGDEISEIWEAVLSTLVGGLALVAAVFFLTSYAVRRALQPVDRLAGALKDMEGGNYGVKLADTGPPELAVITDRVKNLAHALELARNDNSRLTEQIISLEDHERRELARELHDEFGSYLFAARANVTALLADAEREAAIDGSKSGTARAAKCNAALQQISALQQLNRGVLQRLRPPALNELGLEGAIRALVGNWQDGHPETRVDLSIAQALPALDSTIELTVYRIVQEGLTNAFRHAKAAAVQVHVATAGEGLSIRVQDDGQGRPDGARAGFGLSGMTDRIRALGGQIRAGNGPSGGFLLDASLPVTPHGAVPPLRRDGSLR